jgi:hypothetical protein
MKHLTKHAKRVHIFFVVVIVLLLFAILLVGTVGNRIVNDQMDVLLARNNMTYTENSSENSGDPEAVSFDDEDGATTVDSLIESLDNSFRLSADSSSYQPVDEESIDK